jgi:hypothetical protein
MSNDEQFHLPWNRNTLESLLHKVISTGETTKVDFKSNFDLSGNKQKAELLKDVSAFANTYDHNYRNHGFILFGVMENKIIHTSFPNNEDHLQANIDDLVNKYLGPFITTNFFIFDDGGKQWGVLVIPPTRNAPHVFIKDIHKRYRGDIYVRNGTITEKALPGDYARFFRQHLEEHTYNFQQSISDLQHQLSDLHSRLKRTEKPLRRRKKQIIESKEKEIAVEPSKEGQPVTEIINDLFAKEEDIVTKGLFEEVRKINKFLKSGEIPWAISTADKKQSEEICSKIESISSEFWSAITILVLKDEKGIHDNALVKALQYLARQIEPPSGTSCTEWGANIRYYPLFIALYLISIIGVAKKRDKLLKRILKINLQGRSHYEEPLPITYILFLIRRANGVFHPFYSRYPQQKWCDPVASYTKLLIDKILNPDDPLWDKETAFYRGEFVLCITPLDILEKETKKPMIGHPSSGSYLFISSTVPILTQFLKDEREWLKKVFERPFEELLSEFDQTAMGLAPPGCWTMGFHQGALVAAFPEKTKRGT